MDEMEQLGGVGLSVDRNDQVDFSSLLIGRRLLRDWEGAEFPQSLVEGLRLIATLVLLQENPVVDTTLCIVMEPALQGLRY